MHRKDVWAAVVHAVPTIGLLLQGLLYVTTSRFMPYHGDALDVTWEALPLHYQGFILGVIKGMGAGSIGVSLALLIMIALPFRRGEAWARWAVPVVGITFTLLTAHAAYTIDVRTAATPPWRQTLGLTAIYVTGAVLSLSPRRVKAPATEP
jgi:hypothetical protein